ncbi:MAG: hypothetical protein KC776_42765 [Myxococcales bacterium]|nr:hypothetical protein [Myxococcales bacterium]MCB9577497.1 hypothetical protein [Polyangiaceae bacterium]
MTRALAIANDPVVEEAATEFLGANGSATGAVLCGFFAAAGAYAGVLLGPVSVLAAGVGAGARAFDGRLRQPGLGTRRPRGFKADEEVPDEARVAVPASIPAALVAHAYDGGHSLASIVKPGISRAQRAGAAARASLLRLVRTGGAGAFTDVSFVRPLLRVAGPSQGGLLTTTDFSQVPDVDHEATLRDGLYEPPWAEEGAATDTTELGVGCAVCAVDVRGNFAALSYRRLVDGFLLEDLELEAPLAAVPVKRGVARVAPGAPLSAPAPIAIRTDGAGAIVEVLAAPNAARLDVATAPFVLRRSASSKQVEALRR